METATPTPQDIFRITYDPGCTGHPSDGTTFPAGLVTFQDASGKAVVVNDTSSLQGTLPSNVRTFTEDSGATLVIGPNYRYCSDRKTDNFHTTYAVVGDMRADAASNQQSGRENGSSSFAIGLAAVVIGSLVVYKVTRYIRYYKNTQGAIRINDKGLHERYRVPLSEIKDEIETVHDDK